MMLVRVTRLRSARDLADRAVLRRGVVLGDDDHRGREAQTDEAQPNSAFACDGISDFVMNQNATAETMPDTITPLYSAFMILPPSLAFTKKVPRIDEMMDAAPSASGYTMAFVAMPLACPAIEQAAEQHRRDDGHRVGLEEVRSHARAVAHVVADVVGDHRGVARIVFRNARFDLADEIRADVRTLGEDAAAESREDRDERAAERETHQCMKRIFQAPAACERALRSNPPRRAGRGPRRACRSPRRRGMQRSVHAFSPCVAACAVRTLARTEMFIPM